MAVRISMMMTAAQEPSAHDIHDKTESGDRNCFAEVYRNMGKETADRFVADQHGSHRQDDGAGEAGEIAKLARAKG